MQRLKICWNYHENVPTLDGRVGQFLHVYVMCNSFIYVACGQPETILKNNNNNILHGPYIPKLDGRFTSRSNCIDIMWIPCSSR